MASKANKLAVVNSLRLFNADYNLAWDFGMNWDSTMSPQFETYVNKYLFPKLSETQLIDIALGNRFDWLYKEITQVGQGHEEYVFMDIVPVSLNLDKHATLMLERNYPKMATKLYGAGQTKKTKFTLNNNDVRQNFFNLGDATSYAIGVLSKHLSSINFTEESECKAMAVDYALNQAKMKRTVTSTQELCDKIYTGILNIQNNTDKYNECNLASAGAIGRYTTISKLEDIAILTTDETKSYMLNTKIANTFNNSGIDITKRIMSFEDLGGTWKLTNDVTITDPNTITYFRAFGDYQIAIGDVIPMGAVITFDIKDLTEFVGNVIEIKPTSDLFAFVFDINTLRFSRCTKGMIKDPFYNGEFDEVTHWLHYYSRKNVSPFYNKITFGE